MSDSRYISRSGSRVEAKRRKKAARSNKIYRILAAVLIIAGLGILGYSFSERLVFAYRQNQLRSDFEATAGFRNLFEEPPEKIEITEWQPMMLIIPAIDVELVVQGGVDVFDMGLLEKGPVHFQMSDLPSSESGNVAFAGHRRNNIFIDLDLLEEGDEIYLDIQDGYRFIYQVEWVKVVCQFDWEPIYSTDYPAITLQTCEPRHVLDPIYRLMARGRLVDVIEIPAGPPGAD